VHDATRCASQRRGDPQRRVPVRSVRAARPLTRVHTQSPVGNRSMLVPALWGLVVGVLQAGSPLALRWLDPATVYALELALIAAVYIGVRGRRRKTAGNRRRERRRWTVRPAARDRRHRDGVAARARLHRPWAQGRLAAAPPVRHQHTMVAPVLRRRRLARRRHPRHRGHRRSPRQLGSAILAGRRGATKRSTRPGGIQGTHGGARRTVIALTTSRPTGQAPHSVQADRATAQRCRAPRRRLGGQP
jgi:hypothetical protein